MRDTISGFGMKARVIELAEHLKAALFPTLYEREISTPDHLPAIVLDRVNTAAMELNGILEDVFINSCNKQERAGCDAGNAVAGQRILRCSSWKNCHMCGKCWG